MDCEKKSYPGKATARKALKGMKGLAYETRGLHVYWCRDCGAYHIGHAWAKGRVRI